MIDMIKIFLDICLEHKCRFSTILGNFSGVKIKTLDCLECSFGLSVGIRIVDETFLEQRFNDITQSMMDYSVTKMRFTDFSGLWLAEYKILQWFGLIAMKKKFYSQLLKILL